MTQAWILVDAFKKGTEKQCLGLAQALGYNPDIKSVAFSKKIDWLPPRILTKICPLPQESPPDIFISGGRRAAALGAALKRRYPQVLGIHLLNPYGLEKDFDWVITPDHDQRLGPNSLTMMGSLQDLTVQTLITAQQHFAPQWIAYPRPYHVVLVGGCNRTHDFGPKEQQRLCDYLKSSKNGTLLVSVSRRTPPHFIPQIQAALLGKPHVFWHPDQDTPNPYEGMLALGDDFLITNDSVSMIMEVAFTGRPLRLFELPTSSIKFQRFYKDLKEKGIVTDLDNPNPEPYTAVDEKRRLARLIKDHLNDR